MMRCWITIAMLSVACGSSGKGEKDDEEVCGHPIVGTWVGTTQNDSITISGDKTFRYSGPDGCVSNGTFACPVDTATQGTLQVSINSSTGGLCVPAGNYTCAFAINGNAMGYDCTGGGALQYRRP